jgi:transcriptional regulator NrdR family protein
VAIACPQCKCEENQLIDSRSTRLIKKRDAERYSGAPRPHRFSARKLLGVQYRRRRCLACGHVYSTIEAPVAAAGALDTRALVHQLGRTLLSIRTLAQEVEGALRAARALLPADAAAPLTEQQEQQDEAGSAH